MEKCPQPEEFRALINGALPDERLESIEQHLADCDACRSTLDQIAGAGSFQEDFLPDNAGKKSAHLTQVLDRVKSEFSANTHSPTAMSDEAFLKFLEPTNAEYSLGRIGVYEVKEIIGRGGMGIVLHAADPDLERDVAIKVLSPALSTDESARERFMREARAAAAIDHPSVVPIHGIGLLGEIPYLVMPLLAGGTLQDRLVGEPMRFEQIAEIGEQIAAGLSAAHAEGVVHRDIKPANILFEGSQEKVRIADFGLARALEDAAVTKSGMLIGTPEYMAPEQVTGSDVGQRADLYSMGSVLYHMVAGKPPFAADSTMKLIRKVADTRPAPVRQKRPDTPPDLASLIEDLMAKDPAERPDSADAVVTRLGAIETKPPPTGRRMPWLVAAGLAALAIVGGLLLMPDSPDEANVFSIVDTEQGFASLSEACSAAAPGAVVEIAANGPVETADLTIDQPLTIRAAEGFAPVLYASDGSKPVIEVNAATTLEGLGFRGPPTRDFSAESIVSHGAPLTVANCSFRRRGVLRGKRVRSASIALIDCPTAEVRNCEFYGVKGAFVKIITNKPTVDTIDVRFENSIFAGRNAVVLDQKGTFPIKLTLVRNTFAVQQAICCETEGLTPDWELGMDGNVFSLHRIRIPTAVLATPGISFSHLESGIRWDVGANLYSPSNNYLIAARPADVTKSGRITILQRWHRFIESRHRPPKTPPASITENLAERKTGGYPKPQDLASGVPMMGIEPELVGIGDAYTLAKRRAQQMPDG